MKKILLALICLLAMSLLFGCTENPENIIKENKDLKPFFQAHPDAQLKNITKFTQEEFENEKAYWNENCEPEVKSDSYYKATFADETSTIIALAEIGKLNIICIIEKNKSQAQDVVEDEIIENEIIEDEIIEDDVIEDTNEPTTPTQEQCAENWSCTEWNTCLNGEQSRTCTDNNACETTTNKPIETQACILDTICYDSDRELSLNQSYYTKGYVTGFNDTGTRFENEYDFCSPYPGNEDNLHELYCNNEGFIVQSITSCTNGCLDGACIGEYTLNSNPVETPPQTLCIDSDGGKDYFTKGIAESFREDWKGKAQDNCGAAGPGILREFYCGTDGTYRTEDIDCSEFGKYCFDGACRDGEKICCNIENDNYELLKFPDFDFCNALGGTEETLSSCNNKNYCFDTDNSTEDEVISNDATNFIKSYVIINNKISEDSCNKEQEYYKTPLGEATCDSSFGFWSITCENGCLNGACLEECWSCTDWDTCQNGNQTRTCDAINDTCKNLVEKPITNRECNNQSYSWKKITPVNSSPASCDSLCNAAVECNGSGNDDTKYCRKTLTTFGYAGEYYFDSCSGGTVNEKDFDSFYCCCLD